MLALLWILCSVLPPTPAAVPTLHPFYFSVAEMRYDGDDQALEISVKMFTDDLEEALATRYQQKLKLGLTDQHPDAEVYLALYLREQLNLRQGNENLTQQFLGQEQEEDVTWCYLSVPLSTPPVQLWIRNALLVDQFEGQRNLVHVRVGDRTESMLLQRGKLSQEVSFQ
jgi:hypothetical protein